MKITNPFGYARGSLIVNEESAGKFHVKIGASDFEEYDFGVKSLDDIAAAIHHTTKTGNSEFDMSKLTAIVKDFIGSTPDGYHGDSVWTEQDFDLVLDAAGILKISYHFEGFSEKQKEMVIKKGMITILPV